jgi:hypothetical protein
MARALDERGQATAPTECYTREPPPIPGSARGRTTTPDPDQWSGLSVEIPGGEGIHNNFERKLKTISNDITRLQFCTKLSRTIMQTLRRHETRDGRRSHRS